MTFVRCYRECRRMFVIVALVCGIAVHVAAVPAWGQDKKIDVLKIGPSGSISMEVKGSKEETAFDTLRSFIKSETGFDNEIVRLKDWREVSDKLAARTIHLGVLQGYELAWVREKRSEIKPLALAVNVHTYRTAYVVARRDKGPADFAGLAGKALALPRVSQGHLSLFVERQSQLHNKELKEFFSKMTSPENIEDALDDVVDGLVDATVVDQVGLEAYKRRKPGRFKELKDIARSQPLPPPVIVHYEGVLDQDTLDRFREGLLNARKKEKGEKLLTLFRLTAFENVPRDFDKKLTETREAYPPPKDNSK